MNKDEPSFFSYLIQLRDLKFNYEMSAELEKAIDKLARQLNEAHVKECEECYNDGNLFGY